MTTNSKILSTQDLYELEKDDTPKIAWVKVQEAKGLLCPDNLKMHDLGSIIQSFMKYGLQELPVWDSTAGWIKAGNGRIEALAFMENNDFIDDDNISHPYPMPRGLRDEEGWVMPLITGVNSETLQQAKAYLVDSNNLTLMGGDVGLDVIMRMWKPGMDTFLKELGEQGEFTISIPADIVDSIVNYENKIPDDFPVYDEDIEIQYCCPKCNYRWSGKPNSNE